MYAHGQGNKHMDSGTLINVKHIMMKHYCETICPFEPLLVANRLLVNNNLLVALQGS